MVKRMGKQSGFTIVELLIVVVVIAILAAITIVAYNGIQNRAYDSAVQSDMRQFEQKVKIAKVDAGGVYPTTLTLDMGISFSRNAYEPRNNLYYCVNTATNQYAIGAISKSSKTYILSSTQGWEENVGVNAANTCSRVSVTWVGDGSVGDFAYKNGTNWASWVN
jgi:prepilin-type N-terminal cleavage/methylation domain-containing protein